MDMSALPHEAWWAECLDEGRLICLDQNHAYRDILPEMQAMARLDEPMSLIPINRRYQDFFVIPKELVFNSYLGYMRSRGHRGILNAIHFGRFLKKCLKSAKDDRDVAARLRETENGLRARSGNVGGGCESYYLFPEHHLLITYWNRYTKKVSK
jgi:hypothetical protein